MKRRIAPDRELFVRELVLRREDIPSWDAYPYCLPAVSALHRLVLDSNISFFVGENGSGKSTLLEAIAVAWGLNAEGGSQNITFTTRASHSCLGDHLRLVKGIHRPRTSFFLRAESFFNLATHIEDLDSGPGGAPIINSYGGRSLHEQSHGESFLALLMHRFSGQGFYLLDEPEAALSPTRQMSALIRIHQLVKDGSQFIIATHSPILLAYPGAAIYSLSESGIELMDYEQTDHYAVTRQFLNHYPQMLDRMLTD